MGAVSQISAENPDNTTLASDEMSEEIVTDDIQSSEDVLSGYAEGVEYQTFDVVQQQINNAKSGDTIRVSGYYLGTGTQIVVDKALTIEGDGDEGYAYFDADKGSRIFYVSASGVTLKNLVMRNGDAGYNDGGAVYCYAYSNCRIDNCIIGLNEADYGGGTYYCDAFNSMFLGNSANRGGAMYGGNAVGCVFGNNTASDRGGAIYERDGVVIDQCYFEYNEAEYGGAVYSCADYNVVSNSNFTYNKAGEDGGAIFNNDEYDSGLTVLKCNFIYNEVSDDGGAIYTDSDADTTVRNSYYLLGRYIHQSKL